MNSFSIKSAFRFAFNAVLESPWYIIKLFLYCLGLCFLSYLLVAGSFFLLGMPVAIFRPLASPFFMKPLIFFLSQIIISIFAVCWMLYVPVKALLHLYDKSAITISIKNLLRLCNWAAIVRVYIAGFLYMLLVVVGLILLIIPGIIFLVRFQFIALNIIDKNCGIIESFKLSYKQTKNHFWKFFLLEILTSILRGTVILLPLAFLVEIHVYRHLHAAGIAQ